MIASVFNGAVTPTAPPNTARLEVPLALMTSARGVEVESLSTAAARRITAFEPVALSVVLSPRVTGPV